MWRRAQAVAPAKGKGSTTNLSKRPGAVQGLQRLTLLTVGDSYEPLLGARRGTAGKDGPV
jgi:hypothetical protein